MTSSRSYARKCGQSRDDRWIWGESRLLQAPWAASRLGDPAYLPKPRSNRDAGPISAGEWLRNHIGGDNPSGAATAGSDWTISGAERGALQASRRRTGSPIKTAIARGLPAPSQQCQAFDEARKRVIVAGRRRYKASVPAHPCWDQAVPSCSPLTGWAPGPVAASRPSRLAAALSFLTEGEKAPLGSTHWQ